MRRREEEEEAIPSPFIDPSTASSGEKIKVGVRHVTFELTSLGLQLPPGATTPTGAAKTDAASLRILSGKPFDDPPVYGMAYDQFGGGQAGAAACEAIAALVGVGAIDTMLSNFILPLQENADDSSRIHCSLNLNTETGRLSSRQPNLQNQPALEKDQYRIREAFTAEEGKTLVVADYGQLELRLLAHMTECKSMIDAFASGGCFHSRTAMGMFDHVKAAVDSGECLLEWDYSKGEPPAPLLKDKFGSERRRAKTLNFSIAYGKTIFGLSKDWGVSREEVSTSNQPARTAAASLNQPLLISFTHSLSNLTPSLSLPFHLHRRRQCWTHGTRTDPKCSNGKERRSNARTAPATRAP